MASNPITLWPIDEEAMETVTDFFGGRKTLQMVIEAMKLKDTCSLKEKGMTEDEMAGWHDQLDGQEFE